MPRNIGILQFESMARTLAPFALILWAITALVPRKFDTISVSMYPRTLINELPAAAVQFVHAMLPRANPIGTLAQFAALIEFFLEAIALPILEVGSLGKERRGG